jgi:ketosteroid isomerase-like protein
MSRGEENVALLRGVVDAYERGDIQTVLSFIPPDGVSGTRGNLPVPGSYIGQEGFLKWIEDWLEAWDEWTQVVDDYEAVGERHVVARSRQTGTGRGSGVPVEMDLFFVWEVRDRMIVSSLLYPTREEALDAARAGESEAD